MWSYDPTALSTSEKDQVRLEIGDVDSSAPLLQDEEINRAIAVERNFWGACARCAEIVARKLLVKADVRLGRSLMVQYSKTADQFFQMARLLRARANGTVVPWVGGMTLADKQAYEDDLTLVQPAFARTMQENPLAGGYTSDVDDSQSNQAQPVSDG